LIGRNVGVGADGEESVKTGDMAGMKREMAFGTGVISGVMTIRFYTQAGAALYVQNDTFCLGEYCPPGICIFKYGVGE
jgi:hypothetical protein